MAQLALAWVLREENVASAIVGASRPEQVRENACRLRHRARRGDARRDRRASCALGSRRGAPQAPLAGRGGRARAARCSDELRAALAQAARTRRSGGRRRGLARRGARHAALGAAARRAAGATTSPSTPTRSPRPSSTTRRCATADEIELERESARLWHWRARTTELQAAGALELPERYATFDQLIAATAMRGYEQGVLPHADARRLRRLRQGLPPSRARAARRGALDRGRAPPRAELALRPRERWDDVPLDT